MTRFNIKKRDGLARIGAGFVLAITCRYEYFHDAYAYLEHGNRSGNLSRAGIDRKYLYGECSRRFHRNRGIEANRDGAQRQHDVLLESQCEKCERR